MGADDGTAVETGQNLRHPDDRPIRVLWLVKGLGPGGAERLLVSQAGAGNHSRFRYEAAYLVEEKSHLVADLEALGVACTLLNADGLGGWAAHLRRRLQAEPVDVIHVHSPAMASTVRLMVRTLGPHRPAVLYTEHNRWPRYHWLTRTANRLTFGLDDDHLAVSQDVRETVTPRLRASVDVLVHGIDLEAAMAHRPERTEARRELGIEDGEIIIGTVANLRSQKRYDLLLQAARLVLDRAPQCRFVAVGQGPLEADVVRWHAEQDLGDRFLLLGYRADALRVMSGFDVFTLASDHEGLPVAVMEAMALGIPVVATSVGGIPQAVTDGVEGLLVPPGAPAPLADALVELATDPDRRRAMSRSAEARSEEFSAARATRALEARYERLIAARSPR